MKNIQLRELIESSGVRYWEVAEKIGITDSTFSKWLRHDLSDEISARVKGAVCEILEERG